MSCVVSTCGIEIKHFVSRHGWIIRPVWLNGWVFVYELSGCGFKSRCCHLNFRYHACLKQGVQMHRTDNCSQYSSIIWPVWLNGWVLVYELSGCGFECCCCPKCVRYDKNSHNTFSLKRQLGKSVGEVKQ